MDLTHALRLTLSPARPDVVSFVGGGGKTSSMFRAADEVVAAGQRAITATTTRIFAAQVFEAPCHLAIGDALPDWDALARLLDRHGQVMLVTSATMQKAVGVPPHIMDAVAEQAERSGHRRPLHRGRRQPQAPHQSPRRLRAGPPQHHHPPRPHRRHGRHRPARGRRACASPGADRRFAQ